MKSKRITFLETLKDSICSLPNTIAHKSGVTDEEYHNYRKETVTKLMHLDNQIACYLRKYYGDSSQFDTEFKSYSFFPKGFIPDPYHIENDRYWVGGKKDYLYFIDKLIDYAKTEEQLSFAVTKKLIFKLFVLLFISICSFFFLFVKDNFPENIKMISDGYIAKTLLLFIIMLGTSLILWIKEWRTLLPLLFAMIALYVTMLFTLNGKI